MEEEVKSLKRKLKIYKLMIAFFILIAFGCFMFAFVQSAEAKRQEEMVRQLAIQEHKCAEEALKQKKIAEQAMQMAQAQRTQAEEFAKRAAEAQAKKK